MKANFEKLTHSDIPVLVDFYAAWCGPCQTLSPIIESVKEELGDRVKIIKVDVDKNAPLAAKFQVRGVPTLILFKNGKQLWKQSGVMTKRDLVSTILNLSGLVK